MINDTLLALSADFESHVVRMVSLLSDGGSQRYRLSRIMSSVSLEHSESLKILLVAGNFTSAISLLRLQYESMVRAVWALYAATDLEVEKLTVDLTHQTAKKANKLPLLSEMLNKLSGTAPLEATAPLQEFREYSWEPLSSYVHGGIHAIDRHSKGYPTGILEQALRASNGLCGVAGMFAAVLTGHQPNVTEISRLCQEYSDCLPPLPPKKEV